jgi:hypothetical protein
MRIQVDADKKQTLIWLERSEKDDPRIREKIRILSSEGKKNQYCTAVLVSGTEELYGTVLDLLKHNTRLSAEREVRQKTQASG